MSRRHAPAIVRREDPVQRQRRRVVAAVALLLGLGVAAWLGYAAGTRDAQPLRVNPGDTGPGTTLAATRSEVDAQTIARLRNDLAELRASNLELEQELAFYRRVMAPEESDELVLLRAPRVDRVGQDSRHWHYELVVQQGGRRRGEYRGELAVRLDGRMDGEAASFDLQELAEPLGDSPYSLRFRYFQRFRGELVLPEGFIPEQIILEATLREPTGARVQAAYDWAAVEYARPVINTDAEDSKG